MAAEYEIVDPNLPKPKPPAPATSYLTTDHLGSPRVVTDENGEVVSRRDFMPFGEEIYVGVGDRTTNLKYSLSTVDHIRQRFTGYEKDNESDLDFAQARMYQNKHGRFTAPDPLMASANPANPQTFNRYIYTGNNPINYTDPSGLVWCGSSGSRSGNHNDIDWHEGGCRDDWKPISLDRSYTCNVEPCTIGGINYAAGTVFRFDSGGGHRAALADPGPGQQAAAQGQANAQTINTVAGSTATDIAATSSGGGSSDLSLCPSVTLCGHNLTEEKHVTRLMSGQGASAEEIRDALDLVRMSEIPAVSQAADILSGLISFSEGDNVGGALSMGAALPVVGNVFAGMKWGRRGLNSMDHVRDMGRAGERMAGIPAGPKKAINVDGKNLFPDEVTESTLTEVKNVKRQGHTKQLKAYQKYAKARKLDVVLWTRPNTKISKRLQKEIDAGRITHLCFGGKCD